MLAERKISAVPVVTDQGRLVGIVSEADLLRKEQYHEESSRRRRLISSSERASRAKAEGDVAGDLMTSPVVTIGPAATLTEAARLMIKQNVKRLPVVDDAGDLVGVVSRADMLWVFLRPDSEIAEEIREEIFRRRLRAELTYQVDVTDGIVELSGQLERRTSTEIAERIARTVDGVVDVVNKLTYRYDDTEGRLLRSTP
jgi:CBS-domain-containing membrane protein